MGLALGKGQKDFEEHIRQSVNCHEQIFSRNLYVEDTANEGKRK